MQPKPPPNHRLETDAGRGSAVRLGQHTSSSTNAIFVWVKDDVVLFSSGLTV